MVPLAGTETGAVAIVGKALLWKKQEYCGPAGGESKSMQGKYSYVQTRDIPVLHLELIMISAIGGSCPRANLDERGDLIGADSADVRPMCETVGVCIIKVLKKACDYWFNFSFGFFLVWVSVCMCARTVDQRRLVAFNCWSEVGHVVLARVCAQQLMSGLEFRFWLCKH